AWYIGGRVRHASEHSSILTRRSRIHTCFYGLDYPQILPKSQKFNVHRKRILYLPFGSGYAGLGFQLSDTILDVARRMNINLDEPSNS
ncbi:MAG: hypothetical protein ACP5FH_09545, partial [Terracidiphilus sp.]